MAVNWNDQNSKIYLSIYLSINLQKFILVNLSLKVMIAKNYYALQLIQTLIFYDHDLSKNADTNF